MRFYINNIEVQPRNFKELGLKADFTGRDSNYDLNFDRVVFPREGKEVIESFKNNYGLFHGIPTRIVLENNMQLEYYIDMTENPIFKDEEIEVTIKKRLGGGSFWDKMTGTDFTLMKSKGVNLTTKQVAYVIVPENLQERLFTSSVTFFLLSKELFQAIKDVAELSAALAEAVTPLLTIPPLPPPGAVIALAIKTSAQIAYTIALLNAVIALAIELKELLFPKIRYFNGISIKELIKKSCEFHGYELSSTLLDDIEDFTIIPKPIQPQPKKWYEFKENLFIQPFNPDYPTSYDSFNTSGQLIEIIESWFNARTVIVENQVRIERWDWWENNSNATFQPALNLQSERYDSSKYNTEDIWKRYILKYALDPSDAHTYDNFEGVQIEKSTEQINIIDEELVSTKGLKRVDIPFALGKRKDKLNYVEEKIYDVFNLIDKVVNALGGNSDFASSIESRIGVMQISQQYFDTTKVVYCDNSGKQPENYLDFLKAERIYNDYHTINEISQNGWRIFEKAPVRLDFNEVINLLNNNFFNINGKIAQVLNVEYVNQSENCVISYRVREKYDNTQVITIYNG